MRHLGEWAENLKRSQRHEQERETFPRENGVDWACAAGSALPYRIGRECRCAGYDYKRSRKARYARCKSQSSSCPFRLTQQYKAISCKPSFLPSRFGECVSLTAVHVKNVGMSPASIWSNILGAQKGELSHCERSTSLNY